MQKTGRGPGHDPTVNRRPALFVFAHQDDEVAYLCLMKRLVESGREVKVIWVTDGAYSVPAEVRRRESMKTMKMLGVGEEELEFWEYPDGRSIRFARDIVHRLAESMQGIEPSEVYTVAFEGGHPDHDFTHFAAVTAARRRDGPPAVYEAPLYNKYGAGYAAFNRFIPAETETLFTPMGRDDVRFKLRAILNYKSQLWIILVPALLFGGGKLLGGGEPYREVPAWNYRQPPHEGRLFYEGWIFQRILNVGFSDFRGAVSSVLDR